jgi:hypothetical protein
MRKVYQQFRRLIKVKKLTNDKLNHPMKLKTFYRYMNAYFPDVAIKRVMEDCCDTCIRIATELKRTNLSQEEKELLILCQNVHDEGSRNQRVLMRSAEYKQRICQFWHKYASVISKFSF